MLATLYFLSTNPYFFTAFVGKRTEGNDYIFAKEKEEFKYKPENNTM